MAKSSAKNARQERLEQVRREQRAAARRKALLVWGGLAVVLVLIVGVVGFTIWRDVDGRPKLDAVKSYTYTGGNHTNKPVTYKENPPVGGEHNAVWLNCGIYDKPVPKENAVHSMEHGAVWITYRPDLAKADVDKLKELTPPTYGLLSPMAGIPAPVVVSAWGKQLQLTGANDPRLPIFIKEYLRSQSVPEPLGACTGGTDGTDGSATPQQ